MTSSFPNHKFTFVDVEDFDVPNHEGPHVILVVGVNGVGKTTTIGIITDLVKKNSGTVKVFGYDIDTNLIDAKRQVAVVPQEFNFNIFEKVEDILTYQAGYYGIP